MATEQQLEEWAQALEVLRAHKTELREPDLSLVAMYERELALAEQEQKVSV